MKNLFTFLLCLSIFSSQLYAQSAYIYFDGNNVEALISAHGNHFWNYTTNHFKVPATGEASSVFTSTLWFAGLDEDDSLYVAAERFRQMGYDYSPGPIGNPSSYDPPMNGDWNRLWKINRYEIQTWLDDPINNPVPQDVLDWPAHGDTTLGQAYYLAPFVDVNDDGVYNPDDLDHPLMYGDQMVYFIFNDGAAPHTESGGRALGIEIHGVAYGFDCPEDTALNHALFFHHKVYNRSQRDYHDLKIGMWTDFDLGNAQDDYVGSDPLRNLYFAYNGDDLDEDFGGSFGYGYNLPSQGVRILKGPKMEDDGIDNEKSVVSGTYNGFGMDDGIIDNEHHGLQGFVYHNNASGPTGDPSSPVDYFNYLNNNWRNGVAITYGGTGYDPSNPNAIESRFMLPDSSDSVFLSTSGVDPGFNWHEQQASNSPSDRRGVGTIGQSGFNAGEAFEFDHVYVFAQKMNDRIGAVHKMKAYSDELQAMFDEGGTICGDFNPVFDFEVGTTETKRQVIKMYPNPVSTLLRLDGVLPGQKVTVIDVQGRELMQVQVASNSVELNTNHLSPGIYMTRIEGGSFTSTLKFSKQ
ncbi:MAG: T9SS type A sorting domain-containing protein [Salibacteraceae bacterium]